MQTAVLLNAKLEPIGTRIFGPVTRELRIVEGDAFMRLEKLLVGKVANGGPQKLAKGSKIDKEYLANLDKYHWFDSRPADDDVANT